MSKRLPAGTIKKRADGSVWQKPTATAKEWTQVKDGEGSAPGAGSAMPTMPAPVEEEPQLPWAGIQAKYGLDGHIPPEEVHPQHVQIDAEGNIDSKPVLIWKDGSGEGRRTYTTRFHWNRYAALHNEQVGAWDDFQLAHQSLRDEAAAGSHAAMAAIVALQTGRSVDEVCALHHERVQVARDGIQKADTSDRDHPDRVHVTFAHKRGYSYTASLSDPVIAGHAHGRKQAPSEAGNVFDASPQEVSSLLAEHGVDPESPGVRHHIATHMAIDLLSKSEPVHLDTHGVDGVRASLQVVSDKIAAHFGHDPAPEGMSYVPPAVALAYLEESGGSKHYPNSYAKLRGEPVQPEKVKKSDRAAAEAEVLKTFGTLEGHEAKVDLIVNGLQKKRSRIKKGKEPCSLTEDVTSSNAPTGTSSSPRETPSSTPTTTVQKSSTAGPSVPSSATGPVLDPVLEKGPRYLARLPPAAGDVRSRYVYETEVFQALLASPHFVNVVEPGTRFWCPMNGVDGYVNVEARQSNLVTLSHSGTGRRGTDNVDTLKKLLLSFHQPPAPTAPPPAPVALAALAEMLIPYLEKHSEKEEKYIYEQMEHDEEAEEERAEEVEEDLKESKVKKSHTVLSDIASRPAARDAEMEEAQAAYILALGKNLRGDLSDERMRAINQALYCRDYKEIIRLSKGDVGKVRSADAGGGGRADHPGPQGEPVGTQTRRGSGIYEKQGQGEWKRVKEGRDKKVTAPQDKNLSESDLRDLLSKLRARLHTAPKNQRNELKQRIEVVRNKLHKMALARKQASDTQKADQTVADLTKASVELLDPVDEWLRKAANQYTALDAYIQHSDHGSYDDFVCDLAVGPLLARSQAYALRLQKGDGALRARWNLLNGVK